MSKLRWILTRIWRTLWIRVSLYAGLGVLAALLASLSSRFLAGQSPFDISTDAIESLLSIIATSMLAVTTFSVGALTSAYAAATANATPRATTLLTEDTTVQTALSTFVGSFLFSIVGLVALKVSFYGPEGRAVLFLFTMGVIVLIVIALLRWINQLTKLGRVVNTLDLIETATREAMDARFAAPYLGGRELDVATGGATIRSDQVGYVTFIDAAELCTIAEKAGFDIEVLVLPGTFVTAGTPFATVPPEGRVLPEDVETAIRKSFTIGTTRSYDQDPRFGLVVLTEVALRALSPALNDHGTAIDVIGRQVRLLDRWGRAWEKAKATPPDYPRVAVKALHHDDLVEDAFNLIARDGAGQVDIMLRLVKALRALSETGPDPLRLAARRQLAIALDRAASALGNADDRRRLEALAGRGLD